MGSSSNLLRQHHHRLIQVLRGHCYPLGQTGGQAAALDLHAGRKVLLLAAGHFLFQVFHCALANGHVKRQAHILQQFFIKRIARHIYAGCPHLTAQADHRNVGGAAADVHDHAALRLQNVHVRPQCGGNGLIDQIYLAGTGRHNRFHHGVALNAGNGGRNTNRHPRLYQAAVIRFVDKAANQLLGQCMVGNHAILQRANGRDIIRGTPYHRQGLIAHCQHLVLARIHRHHAGFAQNHALASHRHDDGGGAKVNTNVIICHGNVSFALF